MGKKPTHKASVMCVRFDFESRVVASASLDGTVQITSVVMGDLDKDTSGPFGKVTSFGETLASISCNGWANFVSFSPSGKTIAYGTHDCELNFADVTSCTQEKSKPSIEKVLLKGNPFLSGMFITEDKMIGTGFDKVPYLFKKDGGSWKQTAMLDDGMSKVRKSKITGNSFLDKKVYFNSDIKLGSNVEMKESDTKHANYINCLKVFARSEQAVQLLCTSDINGFLNYWDVQKL